MSNQTNEKDSDNGYEEGLSSQEMQLRSIWQGWPDSNRQHNFWRVAAYH
jgi:hypothetical protein